MWLPEYLEKEGNALLKIIEEPAQKTLFLLVAQNQDQILNTIISRTQIVKIPKLKNQDIEHYLIDKKEIEPARAAQLAYISDGNLQAALQFINHQENDEHEMFLDWLRACWTNNGLKIVGLSEGELAKMGRENQKNFLRFGIQMMRECMLFMANSPQLIHLPEKELTMIGKISQSLNLAKAEAIANELEKAHFHIERNANPKILFLDVSLNLVKLLKFDMLPKGTQHILL